MPPGVNEERDVIEQVVKRIDKFVGEATTHQTLLDKGFAEFRIAAAIRDESYWTMFVQTYYELSQITIAFEGNCIRVSFGYDQWMRYKKTKEVRLGRSKCMRGASTKDRAPAGTAHKTRNPAVRSSPVVAAAAAAAADVVKSCGNVLASQKASARAHPPPSETSATSNARVVRSSGSRPISGTNEVDAPLRNVIARLIGFPEDHAVHEILRAYGGKEAKPGQNVTHVIVPDDIAHGTSAADEVLKLSKSEQQSVVCLTWLERLMLENKLPNDSKLSSECRPLFLRQANTNPCVNMLVGAEAHRQSAPRGDACSAQASPNDVGIRKQSVSEAPRSAAGKRGLAIGSLQETAQFLKRRRTEDTELRFAIQLSLREFAAESEASLPSNAAVLGVPESATVAEVKAAYKEKALETHPDKGGDQAEFCRVRKAYVALIAERSGSSAGSTAADAVVAQGEDGSQLALPAITVAQDFQLRNHRELVKLKFKQDGVNLDDCLARQAQVLKVLGLEVCDVGATNVNEQGETIYNQCFYLSVARSYLGDGYLASVRDTALSLKRVIEEAVLAAHPDWQGQRVGEDVQAFSDFLFYVLGSNALLCELAVAIFDATSGGVEVYIGSSFPGRTREDEQRSNLLTIQYVPGHYRAFVPKGVRPSFRELKRHLDENNVHYVPTYV